MGTLGTWKASGSVRLVRTTTRLPFKERRERGRGGFLLPSFLPSSSLPPPLAASSSAEAGRGRGSRKFLGTGTQPPSGERERRERRPEMAAAKREEEEEEDVEAARSPTSSISSGGSRRENLPRGRFILGAGGGAKIRRSI